MLMLTGKLLLMVARGILKPQLDAKLKLRYSIIYRENKSPLPSSSGPEEDDFIELLMDEIPLVLGED